MTRAFLLSILLATSVVAESYPKAEWRDAPDPIASPYAEPGGEISIFVSQFPKSLNYYLEQNVFCARLFGLMYDSLLHRDPVTLAYQPMLAERWEVSDDKMGFTFHLNPDAVWSDGTPVTAADVQWTYDMIVHSNNLTGAHKVAIEKLERPEILSERSVRIRATELHWRNLMAIASLEILPRHVFADKDFNKVHFEFPVVSGPYRIDTLEKGTSLRVVRREDWWLRDAKRVQGVHNFDAMKFRFFKDRQNAFEAFKKGDLDIYPVYSSRIWVNETKGERFTKNWIIRQRVYNQNPVGFQGWVMNMRRPPFDDVRVRKAIALLVDRKRMNSTIMFNQYDMLSSYWVDLYDETHPCPNPELEFDPVAAAALLDEAGWTVNAETGIRERDGKPLQFRMLARDAVWQKFYDIMTEALKDVGVEMTVDTKDWASWSKDMDEFNFEITGAAWGAGIFKDPESMWHSREAERPSGFNYAGYKSDAVDTLIEEQKSIFDINARNAIMRKIDALLYGEFPYILSWYAPYTRLLYWNKFGTPDTVLSRYSDESAAYAYWWYDEDAAADLEDAIENEEALPRAPAKVVFEDAFKKR